MVSREIFLHDPEYEERYSRFFGQRPDKPTFEIYIPHEFLTVELHRAIMKPIWDLEATHVWRLIAKELQEDNVNGDFIEFGVFTGVSFARHLQIFRGMGVIRKFWGFDSFEGLPEPIAGADQEVFKAGQFSTSRAQAEKTIFAISGMSEDIELVQGWFSESLPRYVDTITEIAFCRIDCDMYSSTRDCLNFVKGRLVNGAVIYFDDWTFDSSTGETKAFFEFAEETKDLYVFESIVTASVSALGLRVWHRDLWDNGSAGSSMERRRQTRAHLRRQAIHNGGYSPGDEIIFAQRGNGVGFLQSGFAEPEPWGVWTIGPQATIAVPAAGDTAFSLWLQFQIFASEGGVPASFEIKVQGQRLGTFSVQTAGWSDVYERQFEIPRGLNSGESLNITLEIENHRTEVDFGADRRPIGIGLHRMRLSSIVEMPSP